MALKDTFAELLNAALPIFNRIKFGNIIQSLQESVTALENAGSTSEALANSQTGTVDSIASGTLENVAIGFVGASPVIQGIAAREANTRLTLVRAAANPMTIKSMASATPADNIALPGNEDVILSARESATFIYVATVGWTLVSVAEQPTETKFIFNPSASASVGNVYKTWTELYAAFLQKAGEGHRIIEYMDETNSGLTIPAGTYDGLFDEVTHRGVYGIKTSAFKKISLTLAADVIVTGPVRNVVFESIVMTNNQANQCVADIDAAVNVGYATFKNFTYAASSTYGLFSLHGAAGAQLEIKLEKTVDIQGPFAMFTDDNGGLVTVHDIPADTVLLNAITTSVGNAGGNAIIFKFSTPTAAPDGNVSLTQVNFAPGDVTKTYNTYFASFEAKFPTGAMLNHFGATAPAGFLACDGASYLRDDYAALFAVIGTTYGAADGTHFNVPDARGLVTVGAGAHGSMTRANGSAYDGGSVGATRNDQTQGMKYRTPTEVLYGSPGSGGGYAGGGYANWAQIDLTSVSDGTNGTPRTGNETRPAEIAVLVCIKY